MEEFVGEGTFLMALGLVVGGIVELDCAQDAVGLTVDVLSRDVVGLIWSLRGRGEGEGFRWHRFGPVANDERVGVGVVYGCRVCGGVGICGRWRRRWR